MLTLTRLAVKSRGDIKHFSIFIVAMMSTPEKIDINSSAAFTEKEEQCDTTI